MINGLSNADLLRKFDELVTGHTQAKKALINLINRSKIRHYQKWIVLEPKEFLIDTVNCLLIGGSGQGKTFLVDCLQQIVNFPIIKVDATRLTLTSASGGIKNTELIDMARCQAQIHADDHKGYYHSVDGAMDQMIIFVDEIDKLAWGQGESDGWNKRVQSSFLSIFENKDELEGVSFIFAGAFSGLDAATKASIGFNSTRKSNTNSEPVDDAIVKYGLIPELVGRIQSIVELDKFTRADYEKILFERLIPAKQSELLYYNCSTVNLSDEQVTTILDRVENSGQGVRALKRELDKVVMDIEFNYEDVSNHPLLLSNLIDDFPVE